MCSNKKPNTFKWEAKQMHWNEKPNSLKWEIECFHSTSETCLNETPNTYLQHPKLVWTKSWTCSHSVWNTFQWNLRLICLKCTSIKILTNTINKLCVINEWINAGMYIHVAISTKWHDQRGSFEKVKLIVQKDSDLVQWTLVLATTTIITRLTFPFQYLPATWKLTEHLTHRKWIPLWTMHLVWHSLPFPSRSTLVT